MFYINEGEIILVNKPYKWTSFDAIASMRGIMRLITGGKIKIGHAGTLDPLATGLLIICTGKATKRIEEFMGFDKEYTGTFTLGATTPSFDLEKEINQTYATEHITPEMIAQAAQSFTGDIMQTPPLFSAMWVNGKRAYEHARNNDDVKLQPRPVHVAAFEITRIALPEVDFRIVCSKGTYIRSLARDFGIALNSGAHLTKLCRTRIGPYMLENAWEIADLKDELRKQIKTVE